MLAEGGKGQAIQEMKWFTTSRGQHPIEAKVKQREERESLPPQKEQVAYQYLLSEVPATTTYIMQLTG